MNEGEHDEEMEDGRDGMPGAGQLPCDDNVCRVEQGPQDGGSAGTRRSIPRSMTCWGTPVVDPGRRAGPKGPDAGRKGIQAGAARHGEAKRTVILLRLQHPIKVGGGLCVEFYTLRAVL